jgi:molybdopterin molybdotransferase
MAQELLSIDEALELVLARVLPLPVQDVALGEAYDRFLARDLTASIDLPPFANSAMDGFALRASDTPGQLRLVGESAAGAPYTGELAPGEAIVISTGAVVPAQADAVVQLEVVQRDDHAVTVSDTVEVGNFIRYAGSDIRAGEPMLAAGTRIAPAQIGAAAAVGLGTLPCRRRPQVAVLTTGTELRPPGEELGDGEIFDANGPMLEAALRTSGAEQHRIPAAADTVEAHRAALEQALEHDVVISSGGVSVGAHDLVRGVGRELGVEEVFWRVAMRPGKPIAFGVRGATLVFGLPGNPVSTLVGFELFVRPALRALQGAPEPRPPLRSAVLATAASRQRERDDLIRVRLTPEGLEPLPGQQSHQIAIAAQADGLALIPRGEGRLPAGTEVAYLPLH